MQVKFVRSAINKAPYALNTLWILFRRSFWNTFEAPCLRNTIQFGTQQGRLQIEVFSFTNLETHCILYKYKFSRLYKLGHLVTNTDKTVAVLILKSVAVTCIYLCT